MRAQITQYRDSLSTSHRSLGSRKLIADRASGDIRNFEKCLKKGLLSSRVNGTILSKIDSIFILLETKASCLASIKTKLKSLLAELDSDFVSQGRKEETIRSATHQQGVRFQHGAEKLANIRSGSIVLQKDFLAAQNMEETTRTQTKMIKSEMSTASIAAEEALATLGRKFDDTVKNVDALKRDNAILASELETNLQGLKELQAREDTKFDAAKAGAALEACQTQVDTLAASNKKLGDETDLKKKKLFINAQAAAEKISESKAIVIASQGLLASEVARAAELAKFKSELEAERHSLLKLEKSSLELQETRASAAADFNQTFRTCEQEQEQARIEIVRLKRDNEQAAQSFESMVAAWNTTKKDLLARLSIAQSSYKAAESLYSSIEEKSKDTAEKNDENLQKELAVIGNDMAAAIQRHEASVSVVLHSKPGTRDLV